MILQAFELHDVFLFFFESMKPPKLVYWNINYIVLSSREFSGFNDFRLRDKCNTEKRDFVTYH